MRRNSTTLAITALIILPLLVYTLCFTVEAGTVTVVKTMGKIDRVKKSPGIDIKMPWPIQSIRHIDTRMRLLNIPGRETQSSDEDNIIVEIDVGWKISNAEVFITRLETEHDAEKKVDAIAGEVRRASLNELSLSKILTTDKKQEQNFIAFEKKMLSRIQKKLQDNEYGIEVSFVNIKAISLPTDITQKVFERMIKERDVKSQSTYNAGKNEAEKIKNLATLEKEKILGKARAEAIAIRGQGDAAAAKYYEVFKKNPELANYLREVDALKEILKKRATVVLPTEAPLETLIKKAPGSAK